MNNDAPCTTVLVGRCHLIAWTLADGAEVINAYVPTTDREYPDGLMLIGSSGGSPTGAATREAAVAIGRDRLAAVLAERGLGHLG